MVERLVNFVGGLGYWGYLVVFLAVTLQSAAFLGFVVPSGTLVLLGGFLAAQDVLHLGKLLPLVCFGAILGNSIGYEIGRRMGRGWALRHGRWVGLTAERLKRVEDFFQSHGGKTVLIGRFCAFLRAMTPFVAGVSHMPYGRFFLYNVLGSIAWSAVFVLLGYFLGESWHLVEHWVGRASAVLAGALVLVLALAWLWRWAVRHERGLRGRWADLMERPRILALRRRFAQRVYSLEGRLTPGGYLGLYLTLGALALIAAAWAIGALAEGVVEGNPLAVVDQHVAVWLHLHSTRPLTQAMLAVSFLGSWMMIGGLVLIVGVILAIRRDWYRLIALLLVVPLGAALNVLLKALVQRHRPILEDPLLVPGSYSFSSGEACGAMLFYGLLMVFAVQGLRRWSWRVLAVLVAFLLVLAIGFSRIYLGMYYTSDVLAGYAEAIAWLAICLTAVETLRQGRPEARLIAED